MCPFSFGILYSFGCCWCYNEAFSCDCYASKSQLNVCSSQKSACHFPRGLRQESVWEPVIFQGLHVCGLCSRNQKRQQQRYLPSPHYISLSDRVSPFCLSSSAHKYSGLSKRKEQQRLQRYMHHFPVPQRLSFFTSICKNQPHSSWFCMLHWTFAFCLAPLAVKKKVSPPFTLSSSKLPLLYSASDVPAAPACLCLNVLGFLYFLFFVFCVRRLFALRRMQRESGQKQQPRHMKNKSVLLSGQYCSSIIALLYEIGLLLFFFFSWTRITTSHSRHIWSIVFEKNNHCNHVQQR